MMDAQTLASFTFGLAAGVAITSLVLIFERTEDHGGDKGISLAGFTPWKGMQTGELNGLKHGDEVQVLLDDGRIGPAFFEYYDHDSFWFTLTRKNGEPLNNQSLADHVVGWRYPVKGGDHA